MSYDCQHFSIALPKGRGQESIPNLLRHLANALEEEGSIEVMDIVFHNWEHTDLRIRDSRRTKLDATVWADWLGLTYEYDLGDSWMHQMTIEKIEHLAEDHLSEDALWITPCCLVGSRACPPEDAGGIGGYALFLEAWQNPTHAEHKRVRQWVGTYYDPELFSVQQVNSALAVLD